MRNFILISTLASSVFLTSALASTQGLKEVGRAQFSVLFWDIYESRLLTSTGQYQDDSFPKALEITYQMDITNANLLEKTIEQWQHLELEEQQYQQYSDELLVLWPNIEEGDTLLLKVEQDKSVFYHNGVLRGEIKDQYFGPMFLAIWLSEKTSQPALREQLIGQLNE